MKNFYVLCAVLSLCATQNSFAQNAKELSAGYYVVVAAFSPNREQLAINYTALLNKRGMKASYGFNSRRNFYYVYTDYFTNIKPSLQAMQEMRKQEEFAKTWVRIVAGDMPVAATQTPGETVENKDATERPALVTEPDVASATTASIVAEPAPEVAKEPETSKLQIVQTEKILPENTEVFLSLYNARNNRIVEGTVKVIDTEKSKLIKEVNGNDYLNLPNMAGKTGTITLVCEAFGYRKLQQEITYPVPLADTAKSYVDVMGTTFIVNFDLVRYHRGDIATLYHVYFFNDAAIMLPDSKFELTSLLQMMQEDPGYRVLLHGHTNGNYHGKIILMGPDKNFFSLSGSNNTMGSAKDLAMARAMAIKEYLIANQIDPSRIEVKSWGGKKPIYDKHSANAKKNVRVEVEVLDE